MGLNLLNLLNALFVNQPVEKWTPPIWISWKYFTNPSAITSDSYPNLSPTGLVMAVGGPRSFDRQVAPRRSRQRRRTSGRAWPNHWILECSQDDQKKKKKHIHLSTKPGRLCRLQIAVKTSYNCLSAIGG